ncbi:uncharacterized protein Z520_03644 [Fonsecaea multimorphosa CBS 102226]|uniref:Transcription factor domain-containing protein n=1 Tax=Fonsecaea multimorphosa CBS 102226 TaxID=1442371 RepID=A0A0D2K5B7_9EURO|nr:uncharacterized protein Z520_03644 [Fonsecaea multimorphosa CBS 102226]KIY00978.1 hypothetical protein Z520_03644 [Fonsecaea multimorphosa CBS 102226]OAL27563.1 hypothetical protein AYO22_03467 [Fonsecaea multimorphosa]
MVRDPYRFDLNDFLEPDQHPISFDEIALFPGEFANDRPYGDFANIDGALSASYFYSPLAESFNPESFDANNFDPDLAPSLSTRQVNGSSKESARNETRRLATAYTMLCAYSTASHPARPSSPQSVKAHERYTQNLRRLGPPDYDDVVINVFIGLFQRHIAPTFSCFQGFRIGPSTPAEVYLGVAAVGGLYCQVPKADIVAKWLQRIAKRKLLTVVHIQHPTTLLDNLSILQAVSHNQEPSSMIWPLGWLDLRGIGADFSPIKYVLMEIFAFISHDPRTLFLLEVFHCQVVQAFRASNLEQDNGLTPDSDRRSLLNALDLLECYRTVFQQRPARFYPLAFTNSMSLINQDPMPDTANWNRGTLRSLVLSFLSCHEPCCKIESSSLSLQSLSMLAVLTSYDCRLPGLRLRYLKLADDTSPHPSHELRLEFLELALQKWLRSHVVQPDAGPLMLYHLVHLRIYCNLTAIDRLAHWAIASKSSFSSAPLPGAPTPGQCFTSSQSQDKAAWHATKILEIAKGPGFDAKASDNVMHLKKDAGQDKTEVIHYSHAVYYASMVMWCSTTSSPFSSRQSKLSTGDSMTALSILRQGVELLSHSAALVSKAFQQILKSL